jgi:hypothetical protein
MSSDNKTKKIDPGFHKGKSQYTTLRIAPSIYTTMNQIVTELQVKNRKWSVSALVNVALLDWIGTIHQLNEKAIEGLYEKYESLKVGQGNLK